MAGISASTSRRLLWAGAAAVVLAGAATALTPLAAGAQGAASVTIQNHMFMPANITVQAGSSVTWTNEDGAPHTVTSDAKGEFNSGWKFKGGHFSFAFTKPGTYPYHCSLHKEMHGTVTVTG